MMDFFVRETRAVVKGPMAMVRYGTCGGLTLEASAGSVIVANAGSAYVCRDPDAFSACYSGELGSNCSVSGSGYRFSQVAPADVELSALLLGELRAYAEGKPALALSIGEGCNVTADSFYSSQGRIDPSFCDDNSVIIDTLLKKYPSAKTMEMETFFLLHLARCCKIPIKAAAAAIVVANRPTGTVMDGDLLDELEREGGEAVLKAITLVPL
ncbi:hypothetical protein B484DRAFT_455763 [Ochromonadaceae sp. CCMP2298]|nr:hypothetical protein B484DRAFT_455763 [Ochromonadaceae sp. CCMP2298]